MFLEQEHIVHKQLIREVKRVTEFEIAIKTLMEHTQHYVPVEDLEALYAVIDMAKKLEEYETAEDEGRLVVLPCKVGETLFCFSRGKIYPFKVRCIRIYEERTEIELWYAGDEENLKFWHITIAEQDIGYKFFFIREEAEKASREMEEDQ